MRLSTLFNTLSCLIENVLCTRLAVISESAACISSMAEPRVAFNKTTAVGRVLASGMFQVTLVGGKKNKKNKTMSVKFEVRYILISSLGDVMRWYYLHIALFCALCVYMYV